MTGISRTALASWRSLLDLRSLGVPDESDGVGIAPSSLLRLADLYGSAVVLDHHAKNIRSKSATGAIMGQSTSPTLNDASATFWSGPAHAPRDIQSGTCHVPMKVLILANQSPHTPVTCKIPSRTKSAPPP
jgi:hypothetical protein